MDFVNNLNILVSNLQFNTLWAQDLFKLLFCFACIWLVSIMTRIFLTWKF